MAVNPFENAPAVVEKRRAEIDMLVNRVATEAMRTAGHYVTAETPVATGLARSNWVMSIGEPFEGIIEEPYANHGAMEHGPAPIERKEENENRDAAREQNESALLKFDYRVVPLMFLRNNVEYIAALNAEKPSRQTEPGFFERSVQAAVEDIGGVWKLKVA